MTDATEDYDDTRDITEGALAILQTLLDNSYAENAKLRNLLDDEKAKARKAEYATQEAKRRYNELVTMLRFTYAEDD